VRRGTLASLSASVLDGVKGECVVVLRGAAAVEKEPVAELEILALVTARITGGLSKRDAITAVAEELGLPKRAVYQLVVGAKS